MHSPSKQFVHLHVHTEYSLLDGACRINELLSAAKNLSQPAIALTDHGNLYAAVEFYQAAMENGIKPIIGCEVYVAQRSRFDKEHTLDSSPFHLLLLCENNMGYHNLLRLVSASFIEGFYSKPRIDIELLKKYHDGIICMSACLGGEIARKILDGNFNDAKKTALIYQEIFGKNNYFIELQNHDLPEDKQVLPLLYRLSKETGIPIAATNDVHYIQKEDAYIQEVLLAIQTNTTISHPSSMRFPTDQFYLKSFDEMATLFPPQALQNTVDIANRCNVTLDFGKLHLPRFHMDGLDQENNTDFFRKICYEGLEKRYGSPPPTKAVKRLEYELSVIINMGYVDYFLIVWDFIRYARDQNIPVGPGRGSGAGSIAAYCVGITGIDPLAYQLLFERFLNPERISMPDFDIDFCYEGRQKVIDYVVSKYGKNHVAQIITFGTLAAKAAVRDVGRALGMPYSLVDSVAKLVPFELHIPLSRAIDLSPELKNKINSDPSIQKLIKTAMKVEGMPRHASTHAAGVVIAASPVSELVPLQKNDDVIVTQYTMTALEQLGLLKMDFLGLRYLTVIRDTLRSIDNTKDTLDIDSVPLNDTDTYTMLSNGDTSGIFQFESGGMRQVLTKLQPEHMEDLVAVISLYRPGPRESIPRYIACRHNPSLVSYPTPLLEPILNVTYGCIVYQEQVMEIFRKLAGYSYARADVVRRAMAKKKSSVMEKERHTFLYGDGVVESDCCGCISNGISTEIANNIFDQMSAFASYAFNKSHAAAYALLTYQTAYLKKHYFKLYMAALLTSVMENTAKLIQYSAECESKNIPILTPDINESNLGFSATNNGIRFALTAVKNVGRGAVREIILERQKNGHFTSLDDFCRRVRGKELNRRAIESLIQAGAFDSFGYKRRQLIEGYDQIFDGIQNEYRRNIEGQIDLFGISMDMEIVDTNNKELISGLTLPDIPEYSFTQLLKMEKDITGLYLSGHPLTPYLPFAKSLLLKNISQIIELSGIRPSIAGFRDGDKVSLIGTVHSRKIHVTKNDAQMCFATLEDNSGAMEMVLFPTVYEHGNTRTLMTEDSVVYISAQLSKKDDEPKLLVESVEKISDFIDGCKKKTLCIKINSTDTPLLNNIVDILKKTPGQTKVTLYLSDKKKLVSPKDYMGCDLCYALFSELYRLIPHENVAFLK